MKVNTVMKAPLNIEKMESTSWKFGGLLEEPDDWISVKNDSIAVTEGGKTLDEALGNAFMMAADQYEELVSIPDSKAIHVREVRDKFRTWEVYVIDRKAQ